MIDFFKEYFSLLLNAILLPFTGWVVYGRFKEKKELSKQDKGLVNLDIENQSMYAGLITKNFEVYQSLLDDLKTRYEAELIKRDKEINFLEKEVRDLKMRISQLECDK